MSSYIQGMNVACAPFLYVMPEVHAFYCISQFLKLHCSLYFCPLPEGAYEGLKLLDEILRLVDPDLFAYLISKNLKADMYAMPPILSFSGCTPPLDELLYLWDFFLAFGIHLNIVCVAAQIVLMRDDLLASERPNLRTFPALDAASIIEVTIHMVRQLPEELYNRLVLHPFQSKKSGKKFNTLPRNFKTDHGKGTGKGNRLLDGVRFG